MKQSIVIFAFLFLAIAQNSCCELNTLSIVGSGRVSTDPDLASFTLYASANGKSSKEALSRVNTIIQKASGILDAYGLPKANYSTSSLNLYPQYNYTNGFSVLIGQQASLSMKVTIGKLNYKNKVGSIYNALSEVNNITISGLTFDIADKSAAFKLARKQAVADARYKAEQYASLGGRVLGKVKKIEDQNYQSYSPFYSQYSDYALKVDFLVVPYGKVEVSASVNIDWNLIK